MLALRSVGEHASGATHAFLGTSNDVRHVEAKLVHACSTWGRGAEAVDANKGISPFFPAHGHCGLNTELGNALGNSLSLYS